MSEDLEVVVSEPEGEQKQMLVKTQAFQEGLKDIESFEIEDSEDFELAAEILKEVKRNAKEIDARRKRVTDPIKNALEEFKGWYNPALSTLIKMEAILKAKIASFSEAERRRNEAAMLKASTAAQKGDFEGAHQASRQIVEATGAKGITVQQRWTYVVEDVSKVPREFLTVNHPLIRQYIRKSGKLQPKDVPGLEFVLESGVIART